MTDALANWLAEHGLSECLGALTAQHVTVDELPLLTLADLDELGLPVGPRRRLQSALGLIAGAHAGGRETSTPERRQVTVMFCDLVGSTELSSRLDPEAYLGVLTAYQDAARTAIARFDGHLARYLGDGLLVFFGYPTAHEDDAERAVRAALAVIAAVAETTMPDGVDLQVRIGVATGHVVAGDIVGQGVLEERTVLGDAPNLAARLEAAAEPGTALISESTLALVPGVFETIDRGTRNLKGIAEPVRVYQVTRTTGMRSRIAVESAAGLTPLVGRRSELDRIVAAWDRASLGRGAAIAVFGEPGVGKSRLAHEFRRRLVGTAHTWLECRGSVFTQLSAFRPVIQLLDQVLGVVDDMSIDEHTELLAAGLRSSDFDLAGALPLITALHSLPLPHGYRQPFDTQQARRAATQDLMVEWLRRLSVSQPIVLLIDDVQWVDASTTELVRAIVDSITDSSILLLLASRPADDSVWRDHAGVETIELAPLQSEMAKELAHHAAGGREISPEVIDEIVRRSDGIALYVEELTRGLFDATGSDQAATTHTIPPALHDPLMARLDSLGAARGVAQLASVLGYDFDYDVMRRVYDGRETDLRNRLDLAVEQGLLYRRRVRDSESLQFRHALIRDAAYESMLIATRRSHHSHVADVLEREFVATVEAQPETLAHHLTEAGRTTEAIRCWLRAGQRANQQAAYEEAIAHLETAIELQSRDDGAAIDDDMQLELWAALGRALRVARGWAHPATDAAWERARQLCSAEVDARRIIPVYIGLGADYLSRGDPARALQMADELIETTTRARPALPPHVRLASGYLRGAALWYLGRFLEADATLAEITHDDSPDDAFETLEDLGVDVGPGPHSYQAWTLWTLGRSDDAWELALRVVDGRRGKDQPFTLVSTLGWAGALALYRRDYEWCRRLGEETAERAATQRIPQFVAIGTLLRLSGDEAERGDGSIADRYAEVITGAAGEGNLGSAPIMLSALIGLQIRAERLDDADGSLALAQAIAAHTGQVFFDAELIRLQGEVHHHRGDPAAAEERFREAVRVAQGQSARSLQLRAATWLARTIADRSPGEARAVVSDALRDVDGAGTADVEEAEQVLASLPGGESRPVSSSA